MTGKVAGSQPLAAIGHHRRIRPRIHGILLYEDLWLLHYQRSPYDYCFLRHGPINDPTTLILPLVGMSFALVGPSLSKYWEISG